MKGFIEVTQKGEGKTLINIAHIVCVTENLITISAIDISNGYRSSYGGNVSFEVLERYDEIYDKIRASSTKE